MTYPDIAPQRFICIELRITGIDRPVAVNLNLDPFWNCSEGIEHGLDRVVNEAKRRLAEVFA